MDRKLKQILLCVILTLGITVVGSHNLYAQCTVQPEHRISDDNSALANGPMPHHPHMAVDSSGNVFAVWYDERTVDLGPGVYITKLDNDGNRLWAADKKLNTADNVGSQSDLDVAVDQNGKVYVAWIADYTEEGSFFYVPDITFTKLDNDGNVLVAPVRATVLDPSQTGVDPNSKDGLTITVEPDGSNVHMAWYDNRRSSIGPLVWRYEIFYNRLDGNGNRAFTHDVRISYYSDGGDPSDPPESQWPSIAVDGSGNAHISWETRHFLDEPPSRIFYNRIDPAGNLAFPGDIDLSGHDVNKIVLRATVAVDSLGNAHITWTAQDNLAMTSDVYYSKIIPDGNVVIDYLKLSDSNSSVQWGAGIDVDGNDNIHIAYGVFTDFGETGDKYHIHYTKLDNYGNEQIPGTQLTFLDAQMSPPDLGVDPNGNAHIIWSDSRESAPLAPWKAYYIKACFEDTDADGDGYTVLQGDCDDNDPNTYPGAPELCDGLDNDCSGAPDADEVDADADGVMLCAGDCDDTDSNNYPGNTEACDGADNDCSGTPGADEVDADSDGVMLCAGDCDDTDPNTYPGAAELCDGLDNDCDTIVPADETDTDTDGYRICEGDCNDNDSGINPGACDIKGNGIDEDCDGADRLTGKPCDGDSDGSEGKGLTCSDGVDNDGDGLIDCDDDDCSKNKACK